MSPRWRAGGLRAQLAIAIALVAALGVGLSFLALYNVTAAQLQNRMDADLEEQVAEWRLAVAASPPTTTAELEREARRFIETQRHHADTRLFVFQLASGGLISSDDALLEGELQSGRGEAAQGRPGLLDAPPGLATVSGGNGPLRAVSYRIAYRGDHLGTFRASDPLALVTQSQDDFARTLVVVGAITLAAALAAAVLLAARIAQPLTRMARVAAAVDAGDLSVRAGPTRGTGEVAELTRRFDRMLDRLERTFARQRDFVSDASHELRTPLTVVRGEIELLQRDADPQTRERCRALLRRVDELDRLVSDMLTLASAEAGRLVEPRPMDVGDFLEDLRRDLPLFGDRDWRVSALGGTLEADHDRLTQVMRNVVRNAAAHTGPGDAVTISATARDGCLSLSVADTGPGIPRDQLELVFERFHRADGARPRDRGGAGLGLPIAKAIVEAHGGTMRAESPPGGGALICIELPGYRPPA